jgi:glycosyltransferase involved in cell wall biosynthesis
LLRRERRKEKAGLKQISFYVIRHFGLAFLRQKRYKAAKMRNMEERKKLKEVLLIAPQPFFADRGTPINIKAMAQRLVDLGFRVHILALPHGEDVSLNGVKIHRCLRLPFVKSVPIGPSIRKFAYDILLFFSAIFLLFTGNFFVIHGIEDGGLLAGLLSTFTGLPFVFDMDSSMVDGIARSWFGHIPGVVALVAWLETVFVKRACAVVTVAESLSKRVEQVPAHGPIFQIEDFPSASASVTDKNLAQGIKDKYRLADKTVFAYTGNLEPYQGIELMLAAFSRFLRIEQQKVTPPQGKKPVLLIVGGNHSQIKKQAALAAELQITDSVIFAGARPGNEMGSFAAVADILLSPRIVGGNTPLKLYTYMASGKPIVATDIESHTQAVNRDSAYLAQPTPSAFAAALAQAFDDSGTAREERQKKVLRAKELVEGRFSEEAFNHRVGDLYTFVEKKAFGEMPAEEYHSESREQSYCPISDK